MTIGTASYGNERYDINVEAEGSAMGTRARWARYLFVMSTADIPSPAHNVIFAPMSLTHFILPWQISR